MGLLFTRLHQPIIIGYLIGGLLVGPYGLRFVSDTAAVGMFAEIGVVLLMFALGVEFSLAELQPVWRVAIFGTLIQVALTVLVMTGVAGLLGLGFGTAVLLGFIVALSSTMIVLKVLMERGELDSMHGRVSLGILIVQDLSVVPMMLALPNLGDPSRTFGLPMLLTLGKAAVLLLAMWYLGTRLVPLIMRRVASTGSREIFLLASVGLAFGTAAGAYILGLSLAVGAFIGGLVASESDQSHQILAEVRPLRDLFATLFFVSVGMLINPSFIAAHPLAVAGTVAAIIAAKAAILGTIAHLFGYSGRTSVAVAAGLAQIGEFSFVLGKMGVEAGLLTQELFSMVLAPALLTIVATPWLMQAYLPVHGMLQRLWPARVPPARPTVGTGDLKGIADHVVICGFGRVGCNVGEVLDRHGIPFLVIDIDQNVIQSLRSRGVPCVYGDAANLEVMRQAMLPLAKLVIIALPDPLGTRLALHHARRLNPRLLVLCRSHRTEDIEVLYEAGADQVIQPEFEASVEAIRYTLTVLGYSAHQIDRYTQEIREAHYRQFLDDFKPQEVATIWEALGKQELQWLVVSPRSKLASMTISDSAIRTRTGAAILAIRRDGGTIPNPPPDAILNPGDALLVMGHPDQIEQLEHLLNPPLGTTYLEKT